MKNFFEPSDFPEDGVDAFNYQHLAAVAANAKLNKLIESWPLAYGKKDDIGWAFFECKERSQYQTYSARLAFIEEISLKPCNHEPRPFRNGAGMIICVHCKVELEAEWKPKK